MRKGEGGGGGGKLAQLSNRYLPNSTWTGWIDGGGWSHWLLLARIKKGE